MTRNWIRRSPSHERKAKSRAAPGSAARTYALAVPVWAPGHLRTWAPGRGLTVDLGVAIGDLVSEVPTGRLTQRLVVASNPPVSDLDAATLVLTIGRHTHVRCEVGMRRAPTAAMAPRAGESTLAVDTAAAGLLLCRQHGVDGRLEHLERAGARQLATIDEERGGALGAVVQAKTALSVDLLNGGRAVQI